MATLDNTVIHGSLNVKDKITFTEDDIELILPGDDMKSVRFGDSNYNMDVFSKDFNIHSFGSVEISSPGIFYMNTLEDMKISSNKTLTLEVDRIKLKNLTGNLYGTQDPNDMDLSNIEEGTLYFRILES